MIHYASEVTIARPPHAVCEALLDPARYSQWTDMVDVSFAGERTLGVGSRGRFRLARGPIKGWLEMELIEFEPDRRVVFQITHPHLDWTAASTLEPADTGTSLTHAGDLRLRGWPRLLEPFVRGEVRSSEAAEALRLKALLEATSEPAVPA